MNQTTYSIPLIIRALGRGKKGTRDLSFDEARFVMQSILNGTITEAQLGAFLMLMRVKEETAEEIAGMVTAAHEAVDFTPGSPIDVNWPAYAGKKKQPSWYLLAAKLLSENGVKTLVHGGGQHTAGRQYAGVVCEKLGIPSASTLAEAESIIEQHSLCYIHLNSFAPRLSELIDMKAELGLRSPVNTLVRHINPLQAKVTLQGMFHPAYMPLHHDSAAILEQDRNIVVKGDGGEFEVRPDSETSASVNSSHLKELNVLAPALPSREIRPETVSLEPLTNLWNGVEENRYGLAATLQTSALVLSQHQNISMAEALATVEQWWQARQPISQA